MAITAGGILNSTPASQQQALVSNYLDLASTAGQGWAQQYVPDLMEKEAEVFGPRTISGFLSQVGAEEAMSADQVVWSEQSRLHLSYKGHIANATQQTGNSNEEGGTFEIDTDIDGNAVGTSAVAFSASATFALVFSNLEIIVGLMCFFANSSSSYT